MYTRNIGKKDRILRFLLAIILLLIVAFVDFNLTLRWIIGIIGVILFITAFVSWCPLYSFTKHSSRGQGLDKITKKDIENAVKEYTMKKAEDRRVEVDIKPQAQEDNLNTSKKKNDASKKKTPAKKKTTSTAATKSNKNATKKAPEKKKTTAKKTTTPSSKKSTPKKGTTKKATNAAAKASTKSVTKKAEPKKKSTTKKGTASLK